MGTGSPREVWRRMWPAVALAGVIGLSVVAHLVWARWREGIGAGRVDRDAPGARSAGHAPLVALWMVSPSMAISLSAPAFRRERQLTATERWTALRYALLHWRYFPTDLWSVETQWLAPDNFQEDPTPVVARRTSPTNIGLQLLGTVSAYDLGFLRAAR